MKVVVLVLFLLNPVLVIAQTDDYQMWQEQVLNEFFYQESPQFAYGRLSEDEERALLNKRVEEAESKGAGEIKSPVLHFIRGILGHSRQIFYHFDLMEAGKPYNRYAPENQALIKEYQSYYRKALDLDDNPDAPEHLTASMLSSMADDVLAAPDIKERAYKKVIALARAGKADSDYEPYEYETYQFLLESYSAQKNPDKYLATLNEMIDRFGSNEELDGYKRHVEEVIAKRDNAAATVEDTYAQAEPYAEPIEEVVAEPQAVEPYAEPIEEVVAEPQAVEPYAEAVAEDVAETSKPVPVAKVAKPKLEPQADEQESNVMLWLLGGVALLGLIWFAFRRRKHSA